MKMAKKTDKAIKKAQLYALTPKSWIFWSNIMGSLYYAVLSFCVFFDDLQRCCLFTASNTIFDQGHPFMKGDLVFRIKAIVSCALLNNTLTLQICLL